MPNIEKTPSRERIRRVNAAKYLLFGLIIFHSRWLDCYPTRPRWIPNAVHTKTAEEMKKDLRIWGSALVAIGATGIFLTGILDPVWGVILVIFGASTLAIQERSMFIPIGMVLLLAGVIHVFAGELGIMTVLGILMAVLGVKELRKIGTYGSIA
jgi:hypothetical protein